MKQLVERRKQKIEPLKRDPLEVALEDSEKIGKYWVNLVRKDLPKHQKYFAACYRKQIQDVKRVAELCQREVMYCAAIRYLRQCGCYCRSDFGSSSISNILVSNPIVHCIISFITLLLYFFL